MEWIERPLGPVDAYAIAVQEGYTGTRTQWVEELANNSANAQKSEKFATGKLDGVDVGNTDPAYHNNAAYYSQHASEAAQAAEAAQVAAEEAAERDVADWLEENFSNPDSPPLDRTLSQSAAAAPADLLGREKAIIDEMSYNVDASKYFMWDNDLTGNEHKRNLLNVPYALTSIATGKIIYANGTINDNSTTDVSPLIPVKAGTYGLKAIHSQYLGILSSGNSYKNGYGFFGADGTTVVARPETLLHSVDTDIFVFDVPDDAYYVRFCYSSGSNYRQDALDYFNQWILLPNANDQIDDSFFTSGTPKPDGATEYLYRNDWSKVYLRDDRVGDLSQLTTQEKENLVSAINEVSTSGASAANDWLAANDLDSMPGDKVNVLHTPYSYETDEFVKEAQILSDGTIRTGSALDKGCIVSPLIPIEQGKYGLKVFHESTVGEIASSNSYKNGYGLYASDGETPVTRVSFTVISTDIYLFEVPAGAKYVRFTMLRGRSDGLNDDRVLTNFNKWILLPNANAQIDADWFTLSAQKQNGNISKLMRTDGSYMSVVDAKARDDASEALARPITFGRRTCAIFKKVCCIGDSFTEGYIMNTSGVAHADPDYSWVKHLETLTGREYVNLGISGATTASWLTNANGLAKAQLPANKSQAYIIGLQINDVQTGLTVGTVDDIGTDNQTYYGCTSKIIDEVFDINDDAHVFLLTQPKNFSGSHDAYRTAILNIVEWYQTGGNGSHQLQVHLIDLLTYYKLFQNPGCSDSAANGHYTAVGWEYTAEIMAYALSNYMNAHPLLFQDVNLIPYGTNS